MHKKFSYLYYDFRVKKWLKKISFITRGQTKNFYLLSLLCKRDVYQYIVAVFSLLRFVSPEKIIIVNDGTLDASDKQILNQYLDDIEFREIEEFRRPELPIGGCWERISAVEEYSQDKYVMQLDADTLFMSIPEVLIEAIDNQQSFCLPTISGVDVANASACIEYARALISSGKRFIQFELEESLGILGNPDEIKYLRACAGLAGYAPKILTKEKLAFISNKYRKAFKGQWDTWGTEQFTSNYILANTDNLVVLPISKYNSVDMYSNELVFVHFIGSHRFKNGYYLDCTQNVINLLSI